ncbi:A24 family peptidase [Vibrio sp. Of7-15]|uniref:prepilin peptidase n=1 Tax=Vibrio sp. Of7-15 TaxID=2724879 RepID=UPI001EF1A427|nr:A24 family peptidase [Vibrio sp. Of7-15]MCG7498167.1 A24 family peptidase [Vibrio sp. Of7-15]
MAAFDYYPWLFPVFAGIFGLLIGSFLNVVIYRLPVMMERQWKQDCIECFPELSTPSDEPSPSTFNLNTPRSRCPQCKTQIRAIDNIPVISWLLLKGQCRHCQHKISMRYPAIELLTASMAATVALYFPLSEFALAAIFFTFVLIAATFIDLDTMLLPDQLTLPLMWGGITLSLLGFSPVSLQDAVIGAIVGYLSLWSLYWAFKLLTGKEGMGYGDFKLLAALGAWLGWQQLPVLILMSSLVGAIFGIAQLRAQQKGMDKEFPFGPYLAISGWVCLIWGDSIITWYLTSILGMPL